MDDKSSSKSPVVRGARACTVCRQAKMKCVGAEDGLRPCQRCKRTNAQCIFEKHKRGRKPGSKLSEASKMLRRLEKGLNSAKLKSQSADTLASPSVAPDSRSMPAPRPPYTNGIHAGPVDNTPRREYSASSPGSNGNGIDDDDYDDASHTKDGFFPAKLIRHEKRNSFFRTILNPEQTPPNAQFRSGSFNSTSPPNVPVMSSLQDPIAAGLITEDDARTLFDAIFLRLNPFINLFDPALHTVTYVRNRCPFLFTTLIMAGCKFFKPDLFKLVQALANEFAVKAFAEAWKRVEVVQAFACLTYWRDPNLRDPNDNRTWTYIGYACRMAVELNLNRYHAHPPNNETMFQRLERRNRERTYLVLFVHDRSLSTQHGKQWMLPECELVRHSSTWHKEGGDPVRPEDVILASFVQLRRIAAETTDMFYTPNGAARSNEVNYEIVLRNCNGNLNQWHNTWKQEMEKAGGESFHFSFINIFFAYCRLFLNSFGIKACMSPASRERPSLQPLYVCFTSALEALKIVSDDFVSMSMLSYSQDTVTVMSAYSAVFLIRLLRSSNVLAELRNGAAHDIFAAISKAAEAYHEASLLSTASTAASYHSRFLSSLVADDVFKSRSDENDRFERTPIDPRLQGPQQSTNGYADQHLENATNHYSLPNSNNVMVPRHQHQPQQHQHHQHQHQHQPPPPPPPQEVQYAPNPSPALAPPVPAMYQHSSTMAQGSELDAQYWKNMLEELGFGDQAEHRAIMQSSELYRHHFPYQSDMRHHAHAT